MHSPTLLTQLNQERLKDIEHAQAQRRLARVAKQTREQKRETKLSPSQIVWLLFLWMILFI
ncbi:MAG: hypothetical protein AAFQ07_18045 [Chloroflexota bacterium]